MCIEDYIGIIDPKQLLKITLKKFKFGVLFIETSIIPSSEDKNKDEKTDSCNSK